jgi:hypothetical protein
MTVNLSGAWEQARDNTVRRIAERLITSLAELRCEQVALAMGAAVAEDVAEYLHEHYPAHRVKLLNEDPINPDRISYSARGLLAVWVEPPLVSAGE